MGILSSASLAFGSLLWAASVTAAQVGDFRLVEELQLGRIEGLESDLFGDIHDLAVDADGRIYVVDPGMQNVRVFDRDGQLVREIAPEGEGPGERRHRRMSYLGPTSLTWEPNRARLWIDDGFQRQVLDSLGVEYRRDMRTGNFYTNPDIPAGKIAQVDAQGHIYEYQRLPIGDTTVSYIARGVPTAEYGVVFSDTLTIDSRALESGETRTTERTIGSSRVSIAVSDKRPERDEHAWTVSTARGTVWISVNERRQLHEIAFTGDTLRTFDLDTAPTELDVSPEGWVWIRHSGANAETTWDLLDNCGERRGSVLLPVPVSLTHVGRGGVVHVVWSDDLDIEYIMRLRLEGDVDRRTCQANQTPSVTQDSTV
ncbi:6-bladed beta-propeller [Candidatus Palauibacter sp.]|uniref:6-bladed beta-propeller n=1 Tax=Candidatus Palauibacter sp. TaxID=3101350 RepID=UPI003B02A201